MTVTLQNVDSQFLQALKGILALKPEVSIKEQKRDLIKEELERDIELYKQGKLKTYPHGTKWKYLR